MAGRVFSCGMMSCSNTPTPVFIEGSRGVRLFNCNLHKFATTMSIATQNPENESPSWVGLHTSSITRHISGYSRLPPGEALYYTHHEPKYVVMDEWMVKV